MRRRRAAIGGHGELLGRAGRRHLACDLERAAHQRFLPPRPADSTGPPRRRVGRKVSRQPRKDTEAAAPHAEHRPGRGFELSHAQQRPDDPGGHRPPGPHRRLGARAARARDRLAARLAHSAALCLSPGGGDREPDGRGGRMDPRQPRREGARHPECVAATAGGDGGARAARVRNRQARAAEGIRSPAQGLRPDCRRKPGMAGRNRRRRS